METCCESCIYFDLFLQKCVFYENNPFELDRPCDLLDSDFQSFEDTIYDLEHNL